jgi:FkbM family methyltransferase
VNSIDRDGAAGDIRRLAADGRVLRGYVPHIGWLWHLPGDQLMSLLRQGYFEAQEQAFAWLYLRPRDWLVDGGANTGLYSLLAAHATAGRARVLSVEASPTIADLLEANLAAHRVRGAAVRAALWNAPGSIRFELEAPDRSAYAHVAFDEGAQGVEVAATTIDRLFREHAIEHAAFAKLDLEGAEQEALEGAADTLARGACAVWMIEFTQANLARRGSSTEMLGELVKEKGLFPCELDEDRLELRALSTTQPLWFKNVLAVRDVDAVNERLRSAPPRNREIARDVLARAKACRRFQELEELEHLRTLAGTAEQNRRWALETEERLTQARALAAANERWARETEERLAQARAEVVRLASATGQPGGR